MKKIDYNSLSEMGLRQLRKLILKYGEDMDTYVSRYYFYSIYHTITTCCRYKTNKRSQTVRISWKEQVKPDLLGILFSRFEGDDDQET